MKPLLALLVIVVLGACSSGGTSSSASAAHPSAPSASATPTVPPVDPPSSGSGGQPDASGTETCAEVRAGVDAFNRGDLTDTVDHFRKAVPLARARAATDGLDSSADLLEAVEYYAELPPQRYLRAAATSPAFARYKAITLGQCVSPNAPLQSPSASDSGGVNA
jgi:hypothetical protein